MSTTTGSANHSGNGDNGTACCLLIICPGCHNVLLKCKFIAHCENECAARELGCPNKFLGCEQVVNRYLMRHHLASECKYRIIDKCCCSGSPEMPVDERESVWRCDTGDHCDNCVKGDCARLVCCPMVNCAGGCGVRLHACKMVDHVTEVCAETVVACVNRAYGCEWRMRRGDASTHLQRCAANVVSCGREWTRRRVQGCKLYQASLDGSHADSRRWCRAVHAQLASSSNRLADRHFVRALSLRDLLYLCSALNSDNRRRATVNANIDECRGSDGALWPLLLRADSSDRTLNNAPMEAQGGVTTSLLGRPTQGIAKHRETSFQQALQTDYPLSVWGSCQDSQRIVDQLDGYPESCENEANRCMEEISSPTSDSDWSVQHLTWDQEKPVGSYTFRCGQAVPRWEWEGHWRQHCDLSAQMDGWIESTCPLAYLGCDFSVARFAKPSSTLVYHPLLDTYCQRYGVPYHDSDSNGFSILMQLPFEVLVRVCSFLDGCSLFHVSRCHRRLRDAVRMLLGNCCVSLEWYQSQNRTWLSRAIWFRPISLGSLEIVEGRTFTNDAVGAVSEHLKLCSFKGLLSSSVDTSPYCLHRVFNSDDVSGLPEFLRSTSM